jgi:preprotein translocase subunit YajC
VTDPLADLKRRFAGRKVSTVITAASSSGSSATLLIWLIAIAAIFYLLILRPARRRQQQSAQVQSQLVPGVQVVTTAGLYGTVSAVEDDVVVLEVAPGVTNRYAKQAIMRVLTPREEPVDVDDPADPEETAEPEEK